MKVLKIHTSKKARAMTVSSEEGKGRRKRKSENCRKTKTTLKVHFAMSRYPSILQSSIKNFD